MERIGLPRLKPLGNGECGGVVGPQPPFWAALAIGGLLVAELYVVRQWLFVFGT